jgi:hypothetical protein
MGLSGATAALMSDIGRQQDRGAVLALDELARRQTDQEFQAIGQQAAILDYEDAYDLDMDGDGMIGGVAIDAEKGIGDGDPENNPAEAPRGVDAQKQALDQAKSNLTTLDYSWGDEDSTPGSYQEPFIFEGQRADLEAFLRETAPESLPLTRSEESYGGQKIYVYTDKFGNSWTTSAGSGGEYRRNLS